MYLTHLYPKPRAFEENEKERFVFGSQLTAKAGGLSSATAQQVKNLWQSFSCGACELEILFVSPDIHSKGVGTPHGGR